MTTIDDFTQPIPIQLYPNCPGVYVIIGDEDEVLYVGSSKQLCRRVSHLTALQHDDSNDAGFSHIKAGVLRKYQEQGNKANIRFFSCDDYRVVERELVARHKPRWNK